MARSRRRTQGAPPPRLILDSGAVIASSRGDARARAVLTAAWEAGIEVSIPSGVVAETVRGVATDASVNRVIKAVGEVTALDEATARMAGSLRGSAGSSSSLDALVVATAVQLGGGVVLTGDPGDLGALAVDHPHVVLRAL
jgi:predicted nucleic acid-binding protein